MVQPSRSACLTQAKLGFETERGHPEVLGGGVRKAISGLWHNQATEDSTYPKGDIGAQEAAGNSSVASSHDNVNFGERHVCQVGPNEQGSFSL